MASNKQVVDQFVIEMGMTETVMKGLAKLEKQIVPVAKRIEDRLNKSFQVDGAGHLNKTFNRIVKDANSASTKIKRALTNAFDIKNAGRASMRGFETQSNAMARRIAKEIQKAYSVRAPRLPPLERQPRRRPSSEEGSGSGAGNRPPRTPRNNTANWIESHVIRNSDNGMTNSMANLGMFSQRTALREELRALANRHRGDETTHEYERAARQVIFGYKQQIAAQRAANRAQERAAFMQHSLENSTLNLVKGFASVYAALDFFKDSLEEGAKRTQARTMSVVAYGDDNEATRMTMRADQVANNYGLDMLQTREQMAQMRMTMPRSFSNDQIGDLFEHESVFAHTTGMTPDAVGRLNYAFQQIAASAHLMGQDFNQITNASPALVRRLEDLHGLQNSSQLKAYYKNQTGAQFVADSMQVMTPTEKQRQMAMDNIIASQGRLNNAIKNGQDQMFIGMEHGVHDLMESLTNLLNDSQGNFRTLGAAIGYVADKLTTIVKFMDTLFMNIDGYMFLINSKIQELRKNSPVWDQIFSAFDSIAGAAIDWIAVITAIKLLGSFAGILSRLTGLKALLGVGGKGAAAAEAETMGAEAATIFGQAFIKRLGIIGLALSAKQAVDSSGVETKYPTLLGKDNPIAKVLNYLSNPTFLGAKKTDTIMDSPFTRAIHWAYSQAGRNQDPALMGYNPYLSAQDMRTQQPIKVQVLVPDSKVKFDPLLLQFPDGSIQKVALDAVNQQHEVQMMSAQGLQGSWQGAGQNAGFSPSSLLRNNS